jgi:hypothetical protein
MGFPQSIAEAVERLVQECEQSRLDPILGGDETDLIGEHLGLGMHIRNEFGLWGKNDELMAECGCNHPDEASQVILRALWTHLRETASEGDLERARRIRQAHDDARAAAKRREDDKLAAQWEAMTDRRCPKCARPCPEFRKTCRFCGEHVG